ncbi:MAG: lipocalin family protein [Prevotella sp.]
MSKRCNLYLFMAAVVAVAMFFGGCKGKKQKVEFEELDYTHSTPVKNSTLFGLCGEASAMNTLQLIADNGDTLNLSIYKAKEQNKVHGGYSCGDRMAVMVNENRTEASLVINETTLLGNWMMLNPLDGSSEVGISLLEGGIVEGINQSILMYRSWRIFNGRLELQLTREGGGDEEEVNLYDIVKLDADSLIFANAEDRFEYYRQH